MAKGWLYKECMYYLSEYLQSSHEDAPLSWTHDESTTMSEEVLCSKGVPIRLSHEQENVSTFIINNRECMSQFIYEYKANFLGDIRGSGAKARKISNTIRVDSVKIKARQTR